MSDEQAHSKARTPRRLPQRAIVPVFTIALTMGFLGMDLLQGKEVTWGGVAITAAISLATVCLILYFSKRMDAREAVKPAGWPTAGRFQNAVSTGRLPAGASADKWMPKLRRAAAQERHMVWIGPLFFGAFAALGVYLVLDDPGNPWFGLVFSLGSAAAAVLSPIWSLRRRDKIQQVMAQFP